MSDEVEQQDARECPYCQEEIRSKAIKCKHCGSAVRPAAKPHGGTCPFCKEEIKADAVRCKHCRSNLLTSDDDCGCQQVEAPFTRRAIAGMPTDLMASTAAGFPGPPEMSFGSSEQVPPLTPPGGGVFATRVRGCQAPRYGFESIAGGVCLTAEQECCEYTETRVNIDGRWVTIYEKVDGSCGTERGRACVFTDRR